MPEPKPRWQVVHERLAKRAAENPRFREREWVAIYQRLLAIMPTASGVVPGPHSMVPDAILEAADQAPNVEVRSRVFPNLLRDEAAPCDEWTAWTDDEVFRRTFDECPPVPGPLWVVADFGPDFKPVELDGGDLFDTLADLGADLHLDVLFVWKTTPRISIIHHSGGAFHVLAVPGPNRDEPQP